MLTDIICKNGLGRFRKAVRFLGFEAQDDEIDAVFQDFDTDQSGCISLDELTTKLSVGATPLGMKQHNLRQHSWRDDSLTQDKLDSLVQTFNTSLVESSPAKRAQSPGVSEPANVQRRRKREELERNADRLMAFLGANVERVMVRLPRPSNA